MPSKTKKQAAFFRAVSHSPEFAKKVDVPQSVGKEFEAADEAQKSTKSMKTMIKKRYKE